VTVKKLSLWFGLGQPNYVSLLIFTDSEEREKFLNSIPNIKSEEKPAVLSSTSLRDSTYDGKQDIIDRNLRRF
jgi:hypothetical protein